MMGGFLGIGGSSSKTDRGWQIGAAKGLSNIFNFAIPQGESQESSGQSDLNNAGSFWKKILSGNRSSAQQAIAPEASSARSASDAQKKQLATSGTARGGGTNSVNQQRDTQTQATLDNMLFGARTEGAKEEAKIGGAELQSASNLLGLGTNAAGDLGDLGTKAKASADQQNAALGSAAADVAMAFLFA